MAGLTLNQLFADIAQYMTTYIIPDMQSNAAIAKEYGLSLVAYEGGNGLVPGPDELNYAVMAAAQNDPQMYQAYVTLINDWTQAGGGLFNQFTLAEPGGQYGFWGLIPDVLPTGSQEYDAVLSEVETPGDTNLDGIVDYSDFQTLEANYGDTNTYWEQGDFNDDGTVNWQDLNILRQNLDPAGFTLSQFAQEALFGQLSTVVPGQSLEYDGYGVSYVSSLPFTSSSGTVELNANSQGTAIILGGASYSEGLGGLANSSVSLTLNGQESQFESTIGVDGSSDTGSSVIFDVYGNGQLLYQSPTLTYASGAIPIDVNVAGVTTLTLTMSAAPGSTASNDHGVWADARLISTANFGSTQPYTMTWQLAQNGTVLSTQTADSFVFGAISGTYTLTLTVTDAQGDMATASTSVVVTPAVASASQGDSPDTGTEGQWIGIYGTQGYDVIGGPSSLPGYATVTPSGQATDTWAASTNSPQALQVCAGPFGVGACWYSSTSFTVNVNLTDGQSHNLAVYALDYSNSARQEEIQIISVATGAVLDEKIISSFADGVYLQWTVTGDVDIEVTRLAGPNAVLSGLFFDPASSSTSTGTSNATFLQEDTTTEGSWIGYGSLGYDVIGAGSVGLSLPSDVTVTPAGEKLYTWANPTTSAQGLEIPPTGSSRIAAAWYSTTSFTVDVDVTDSASYNLELYLYSEGNNGRVEQVQFTNANTDAVLSTETVSSFEDGVYMNYTISGNVLITFTDEAGNNAVLSGLFFDPASSSTSSGTSSATFLQENTTTAGSWIGKYGSLGYDVIGAGSAGSKLPSDVTVTPAGEKLYTWANPTTSAQGLEIPPTGSSRIEACWYSTTSFTVDVDVTDSHVVQPSSCICTTKAMRTELNRSSSPMPTPMPCCRPRPCRVSRVGCT